jgi:hypothetical protein
VAPTPTRKMKWELVGINQSGSSSSPQKSKKCGFAGKTLLPLFPCAYSHFRATPTPSPPPLKGVGREWEQPRSGGRRARKTGSTNESHEYIHASHKQRIRRGDARHTRDDSHEWSGVDLDVAHTAAGRGGGLDGVGLDGVLGRGHAGHVPAREEPGEDADRWDLLLVEPEENHG